MEKIDLGKHREVFKILPEQEYKKIEQSLEQGLYLTEQGMEGEKRLWDENLRKALPSLYNKFKEIERLQEKQENVRVRDGKFKEYFNFLNWSDNKYVSFLTGEMLVSLFTVSPGIAFLMKGSVPAGLCVPLVAYGAVSFVSFFYNMIKCDTFEPRYCYSPNFAPVVIVQYIRDSHRRRKIGKQKKKLSNNILEITGSVLGYTEKWARKQEKELIQILENEEKEPIEFVCAYNEVEKRLAPLHKIGLHKEIENHLYGQWNKKKKDTNGVVEKFCKARNAGVVLDSLGQELKEEITRKRKHHTEKAKNHTKITNYHTKEAKKLNDLLEKVDG